MCKHHWLIERAVNCGLQRGVCVLCGEERMFPVYSDCPYNRSLDESKLKQEEFYAVESALTIIENSGMKR